MSVFRRLSDVFAAGRLRPGATREGFTLIEVLMAAFVLALGVLGLSALFAGAARQQQLASQQTRSTSISQSADAMISGSVGKIGLTNSNCSDPIESVNIYSGQPLYPGQWFVVPIKIETANPAISFVSINPDEQWGPGNAYFREKPNQQLPRLLYRAIPDGLNHIPVGKTGMSPAGQDITDQAPFTYGAPAFDGSFGFPRVLSDSVQIRVVTMGYGCKENQSTRYLLSELPQTTTFTLNPDTGCSEDFDYYSGNREEHTLSGSDGASLMQMDQKKEISDDDFAQDPLTNASKLTLMWVRDVDASVGAGLPNNDINCDSFPDYVEVPQGTPNAIPIYLDQQLGGGANRFQRETPAAAGTSFYQLDATDPTKARLANYSDAANPTGAIFTSGAGGDYTTDGSGPNATLAGYVVPVNANWRFVSEIWLESFEYRGHRLVSASDRVWYTQDPSRPSGRRADVAYSLLYRDLGPGADAQYIVFTYALRPASNKSDYVPPEQKVDIQGGRSPVTLVEDVKLDYDPDLGKYYIEVPKAGRSEWVAQPGQIVIFAGDGSGGTPILGADAPVSVQFKREINGNVRGYLASAPRIGNQSLLEAASPTKTFNVWAVQPSVTSLDDSKSEWGLSPIEARVFQVFEN